MSHLSSLFRTVAPIILVCGMAVALIVAGMFVMNDAGRTTADMFDTIIEHGGGLTAEEAAEAEALDASASTDNDHRS